MANLQLYLTREGGDGFYGPIDKDTISMYDRTIFRSDVPHKITNVGLLWDPEHGGQGDIFGSEPIRCVSHMTQIFPSCVWKGYGGRGYLIVARINYDNLDFDNSAFQFRHLHAKHRSPELKSLAEQEEATWSSEHQTFIPFKIRHPEGYRGVYGTCEKFTMRKILYASHVLPFAGRCGGGIHFLQASNYSDEIPIPQIGMYYT